MAGSGWRPRKQARPIQSARISHLIGQSVRLHRAAIADDLRRQIQRHARAAVKACPTAPSATLPPDGGTSQVAVPLRKHLRQRRTFSTHSPDPCRKSLARKDRQKPIGAHCAILSMFAPIGTLPLESPTHRSFGRTNSTSLPVALHHVAPAPDIEIQHRPGRRWEIFLPAPHAAPAPCAAPARAPASAAAGFQSRIVADHHQGGHASRRGAHRRQDLGRLRQIEIVAIFDLAFHFVQHQLGGLGGAGGGRTQDQVQRYSRSCADSAPWRRRPACR